MPIRPWGHQETAVFDCFRGQNSEVRLLTRSGSLTGLQIESCSPHPSSHGPRQNREGESSACSSEALWLSTVAVVKEPEQSLADQSALLCSFVRMESLQSAFRVLAAYNHWAGVRREGYILLTLSESGIFPISKAASNMSRASGTGDLFPPWGLFLCPFLLCRKS